MKKQSMILCLLALLFGVSMMFSSCKDDENVNDNPNEELQEKSSERGEALLSILSMVAELDSLPDDWYRSDYTVEPTVGTVKDDSNPYVRYIAVNNIEEADDAYKSMISGSTVGAVKNDKWSKDGIGSLTFNVLNEADVYATVDVDVKQLPHLTQIRFVPASVLPDNGSFSGTPWYSFGDVVMDEKGAHWICVRPADKSAGKSKTHWVSFDAASMDNFKEYTKAKYRTLILPDNLGNKAGSEEHIMNFFKLLAAISPGVDAIKNSKTQTFEDLELSGVKVSKETVEKIASYWNSYGFIGGGKNLFVDKDMAAGMIMNFFAELEKERELNLFYYGHHIGKTDVADVHFLTVTSNLERTPHEAKFNWPTEGKNKTDYLNKYLDFSAYLSQKEDMIGEIRDQKVIAGADAFPKNLEAFVVCYKTGAEISDRHTLFGKNDYDPSKRFISYSKKNIQDIYVLRNELNNKE